MDFSEWISLPADEQERRCQLLDPYGEKEVFEGVEKAFTGQYGRHPHILEVHCGQGPFIGPFNSIVVVVTESENQNALPPCFLGFPVMVETQ